MSPNCITGWSCQVQCLYSGQWYIIHGWQPPPLGAVWCSTFVLCTIICCKTNKSSERHTNFESALLYQSNDSVPSRSRMGRQGVDWSGSGKGTGGARFWMREWTFRFHKMRGISLLVEDLLASQKGLCFMKLNCHCICRLKILSNISPVP
jgi:hypothetical protein